MGILYFKTLKPLSEALPFSKQQLLKATNVSSFLLSDQSPKAILQIESDSVLSVL